MKRLALLLGPLMLAACTSAPTVSTESEPGTDFSVYNSYIWGIKPSAQSPLASQRIVAEVDARLKAQGWTESTHADADVTLVAHMATTHKYMVDSDYKSATYVGAGWNQGSVMGSWQPKKRSYRVGTVILDMFDTKTRQAIWRGTASTTVPESTSAANAKIDAGIAKMFYGFPAIAQ